VESGTTGRGSDLRLVEVTRRHGGVAAVDRVSLDVRPGEFVTLLGPSGCGKTTLLKTIAGFLRPDGGQVVLQGRVVNDVLPHQRNIGLVFQHFALFPHMTVEENVAFGLRMRKTPRETARQRVREMLDLVKLPRFGDRYPHQLSGGQQQRVALARVLAVQPVLLLLDEPFGSLDKKLRVEMQIEVKQLVQSLAMTTVLVTHDQEEAMRMADRVAVMTQGRVVQCDTPATVYDHPHDLFVADFIGVANLLRARVLARTAAGLRLAVAGGELEVPANGSPAAGGDRVAVIRPENLLLSPAGSAPGPAWSGRVTFALRAGPIMEYEVTVGDGTRLRVVEPRGRGPAGAWEVGARVEVSLADPAACRTFEALPP
jgi:putative spermidine/putrescine transport system ATP-binding protein